MSCSGWIAVSCKPSAGANWLAISISSARSSCPCTGGAAALAKATSTMVAWYGALPRPVVIRGKAAEDQAIIVEHLASACGGFGATLVPHPDHLLQEPPMSHP